MDNPPKPRPLGIIKVFLSSVGLALLLTSGFSFLACSAGFLFSGVSALFVTLVASVFCVIIALTTAAYFRRKQLSFGGRTLVVELVILAFIAVGILSWLDTRHQLRLIMRTSSVPSGLRVHRGRNVLFNCNVHFTAGPADIASLIQSKGLIEVPENSPVTSDSSAADIREQSKTHWGWWKPTSMANPRFYFLHHTSEGWGEGWWVSGATNEVYAFIGS